MAKMDTVKVRPKDTRAIMNALMISARPAFIWGPPGIGKSAIAQDVATQSNKAFVDIRLSQMDPTDIRGMPYKIDENGVTVGVAWSPPLIFPLDLDRESVRDIPETETLISFATHNPTGVNGIHYVKEPEITVESLDKTAVAQILSETADSFIVRLVSLDDANKALDDESVVPVAGRIKYHLKGEAEALIGFEEMNSAPPAVLAACYQVILDRRIGDFKLGEGVSMFAMGNRETDKGVSFSMPTPLLNRFIHIEMEHNFDDWQEWAVSARVESDVVGFLSRFNNLLFDFNPASATRGFPTPRSWVHVSDVLKSLSKGAVLNEVQLMAIIYGGVGEAAGVQFYEFRKIADKLPTAEAVLTGQTKKLDTSGGDSVGLMYAMVTSLLYRLRDEHDRLVDAGIDGKSTDEKRNDWYSRCDNYIKFSMDNFKPEVNIMGIRSALQTHGLPIGPKRLKNFHEFSKEYKDILIEKA